MPPEPDARFFIDETDFACGHALAVGQAPVVHPGHPALPHVPRRTDDLDWIPVVAALGLVVITRDKFAVKAEWELLKAEGLRVIRIGAKADQTVWGTVQLLAGSWARIERFVDDHGPGPWLAVIDGAGAIAMRGA